MTPSDTQALARQFMRNAVAVCPGNNVWIEYHGANAEPIARACEREVRALEGNPYLIDTGSVAINGSLADASPAVIAAYGETLLERMKTMQAYIRICDRADEEKLALSEDCMQAYKRAIQPMTDWRINNTRWLVTSAPTEDFAAGYGMTMPAFEKFYTDVCLVDYGLMSEAVKPLQALMAKGKRVRIVSPAQETDLSFSIEDIDAIPCTGKRNIPDGECFSAPVRNSINGTIKFGPSSYEGQRFQFIKLRFKDGRVEEAEAENPERTAKLNAMLDIDEGARYTGEFAISFNPQIKHPVGDILFDEKIDGALHIALGKCYNIASNGNNSVIHWDMIHIQRPDYSGGEIWIDDQLIRKDGVFVPAELQALNPEGLKAALFTNGRKV